MCEQSPGSIQATNEAGLQVWGDYTALNAGLSRDQQLRGRTALSERRARPKQECRLQHRRTCTGVVATGRKIDDGPPRDLQLAPNVRTEHTFLRIHPIRGVSKPISVAVTGPPRLRRRANTPGRKWLQDRQGHGRAGQIQTRTRGGLAGGGAHLRWNRSGPHPVASAPAAAPRGGQTIFYGGGRGRGSDSDVGDGRGAAHPSASSPQDLQPGEWHWQRPADRIARVPGAGPSWRDSERCQFRVTEQC